MKVKFKHEPDGHKKCPNCNFESVYFFRLDGWNENDWLCGNCFSEDLLNGKYFIETNDYCGAFNIVMEHFDFLAPESRQDIHKKLKRLGL